MHLTQTQFLYQPIRKMVSFLCLKYSDQFKIYIAENEEGVLVGQVRLEKEKGNWKIDYSVDQFARGLPSKTNFKTGVIDQFAHQRHTLVFVAFVKDTKCSLFFFHF